MGMMLSIIEVDGITMRDPMTKSRTVKTALGECSEDPLLSISNECRLILGTQEQRC